MVARAKALQRRMMVSPRREQGGRREPELKGQGGKRMRRQFVEQ